MVNTKDYKTITLPKQLNVTTVGEILRVANIIFQSEERLLPMYALDLSKVTKANVLGMLLIYKIIEYSIEKKCFFQPAIFFDSFIEDKWTEYQFVPLINSYIKSTDSSPMFKDFKIQLSDNFILAPQPLLRDNDFTNIYLKNKFLPKISEYYKGRDKVISMIFTCFSEILLNFWEHAVEDSKSIMIADGNKSYMHIACADTGNGIISTLMMNEKYRGLSKEELILESIKKNTTSKENTYHMGYGLWLIDQIVTEIKGRFHLFSEGVHYSNEYGKIKVNSTSYWRGTIVYLALPINNAKSLCDIKHFKTKEMEQIKIDFI
ncbi:MAG: ATP-binding protein [Paludibacter sp.]